MEITKEQARAFCGVWNGAKVGEPISVMEDYSCVAGVNPFAIVTTRKVNTQLQSTQEAHDVLAQLIQCAEDADDDDTFSVDAYDTAINACRAMQRYWLSVDAAIDMFSQGQLDTPSNRNRISEYAQDAKRLAKEALRLIGEGDCEDVQSVD